MTIIAEEVQSLVWIEQQLETTVALQKIRKRKTKIAENVEKYNTNGGFIKNTNTQLLQTIQLIFNSMVALINYSTEALML